MPLQRFSSWSFVALRGQKEVFSAALRVLRGQKGFKVFSVPLRGQTKLCPCKDFLRGPSWPFVDKKRCSPRPSASSADKKGLRCSPCPFADRPNYALAKIFFVVLRGPSWTKRGVLRGPPRPPRTKRAKVFSCPFADRPNYALAKIFFVVLRGPSWKKRGVLRAPSRTDQIMPLQRFSSWSFVALRGQKEVFSAALRVLRG